MMLFLTGNVAFHRSDWEKPMENMPYPPCHANSAKLLSFFFSQSDELRFISLIISAASQVRESDERTWT